MSKFSYSTLESLFNKMTLRERLIMFGALVLCTVVISYYWIIEPSFAQQSQISHHLQKSYQEEKAIKKEITTTTNSLKKDPLEEINSKIAFAEATLRSLDKQLDEKLVKFIHAQKMPIALSNVLSKTPGVKITTLKSLPVKIFNTSQNNAKEGTQSLFYQHSLEITLQGSYNAIYQYLLNVETLHENFYWHSLDYKVSDYPLAEVTIQIYTLSDQQDLVSG